MNTDPVTLELDIRFYQHKERMYWYWDNMTGENIPYDVLKSFFDKNFLEDEINVFCFLDFEKSYRVKVICEFDFGDTSVGMQEFWYIAQVVECEELPKRKEIL